MIRIVTMCFMLMGWMFVPGTLAHAEAARATPAAYIQDLGYRALEGIVKQKLSDQERAKRVRVLLRESFDIQTIARFTLGRHWRTASEDERKEFIELFETMVVSTYAARFREYAGQQFHVEGERDIGRSDKAVISRIIQKNGPPISMEWRVRNKKGALKIVDVVIENISMLVTYREDFNAVIQRSNGKISGLLDTLRVRNERLARK